MFDLPDPCRPGMLVAECIAARALVRVVLYAAAVKTGLVLLWLLGR